MKKTALKFGLTSSVSLVGLYILMCLARQNEDFVISQILVYFSVVLLCGFLFFGIKSYRDNTLDGFITFGQAFKVGFLISLVSSLCHVFLWIILYTPIFKDFMEQHSTFLIEKLKASGASIEAITAKKEQLIKQDGLYNKPLFRAGIIFIQAFPVEAVIALVASFVLKKNQSHS
jgi:ethanolamine transporter EutH